MARTRFDTALQPGTALIVAADNPGLARLLKLQNPSAQLLEQSRRQHSIGVTAVGTRSNIVAGPKEPVQFIKAQPMPAAVEVKGPAHCRRNLDRRGIVRWRAMGNRCDYGVDVTVRIAWRSDNDRAGAILRAFDTAPVMFGTPKKTIANDKTWPWNRQRHFGSTPYSADSMEAIVSSSRSPTVRISRSRRFSNS